jgi:hypothetical protein
VQRMAAKSKTTHPIGSIGRLLGESRARYAGIIR